MAMARSIGTNFWQFAYNEETFRTTGNEHGGVLRDFGVRAWNLGWWSETFVRSFIYSISRRQEMSYGLNSWGLKDMASKPIPSHPEPASIACVQHG